MSTHDRLAGRGRGVDAADPAAVRADKPRVEHHACVSHVLSVKKAAEAPALVSTWGGFAVGALDLSVETDIAVQAPSRVSFEAGSLLF